MTNVKIRANQTRANWAVCVADKATISIAFVQQTARGNCAIWSEATFAAASHAKMVVRVAKVRTDRRSSACVVRDIRAINAKQFRIHVDRIPVCTADCVSHRSRDTNVVAVMDAMDDIVNGPHLASQSSRI